MSGEEDVVAALDADPARPARRLVVGDKRDLLVVLGALDCLDVEPLHRIAAVLERVVDIGDVDTGVDHPSNRVLVVGVAAEVKRSPGIVNDPRCGLHTGINPERNVVVLLDDERPRLGVVVGEEVAVPMDAEHLGSVATLAVLAEASDHLVKQIGHRLNPVVAGEQRLVVVHDESLDGRAETLNPLGVADTAAESGLAGAGKLATGGQTEGILDLGVAADDKVGGLAVIRPLEAHSPPFVAIQQSPCAGTRAPPGQP